MGFDLGGYTSTPLHGGDVGQVQLLTGGGEAMVLKTQRKWERLRDPHSWRREYDLYTSGFSGLFDDALRLPRLFDAQITDDQTQILMERVEGATGSDLTPEMLERAARLLGRWQGRLYAQRPLVLQTLTNLSQPDAMKDFYWHYRGWDVVHDYVRSADCEIPKHLCDMLVRMDAQANDLFLQIEKLPVVLCHRDFWINNIFVLPDRVVLIDWDTTGWGYFGEDMVSLIADEADPKHMAALYRTCIPAYTQGFAELAELSPLQKDYIAERMVLHYGYRLVEWFLHAEGDAEKVAQVEVLQKLYEINGGGSEGG
jgi:thiamine kinase-like enzyme